MFKFGGKKKDGHAPAEGEAQPPAVSEAGEGAEGEAPAKKGLPIKLIAIGLAALLVLGGGGGGAAFFLLKPKADAAGEHGEKPKKKEKKKEKGGHGGGEAGAALPGGGTMAEGPDGVIFYTMPDVVVNMQTAEGRPTFLKLKLTFELPDEHAAEIIGPSMPRLQDMFQTFLRELRPEDLAGSQGSFRLRQEIQRRVNLVVAPTKVNAVLIEEMLIN